MYLFFIYIKPRLTYVLKGSPVRAMRIGSGCLTIACLILPLLDHEAIEAAESNVNISNYFYFPRPQSSPFALFFPSAFISLVGNEIVI